MCLKVHVLDVNRLVKLELPDTNSTQLFPHVLDGEKNHLTTSEFTFAGTMHISFLSAIDGHLVFIIRFK